LRLWKRLFFSRVFFKTKGILQEFRVETCRLHKSFYIIKLQGIDAIDLGLDLVGKEIFYPEEELIPLDKDRYYSHQLVGCQVFTVQGEKIGLVEDLMPVAENDLLIVRRNKDEVLIPFTQSICVDVDTEKGIIVIDPPEGLLE